MGINTYSVNAFKLGSNTFTGNNCMIRAFFCQQSAQRLFKTKIVGRKNAKPVLCTAEIYVIRALRI